MKKTTFRILDTLSRNLKSGISIHKIKEKTREKYGTGYYKNIYDRVQELAEKKILKIEKAGKASLISLNFDNYQTPGILGEMEKEKTGKLIKNKKLKQIFEDLEETESADSISVIEPEKNLSLNRIELLIILGSAERAEQKRIDVHTSIEKIARKNNIRIDPLLISKKEFGDILETGYPKELLKDRTTFFRPDDFWKMFRDLSVQGREINLPLNERDIVFNLNRFGYTEIGQEIEEGEKLPLEFVITSVLASGNERRKEAVSVLLAKNNPNYSLLTFLCRKHNKLGVLFGLIRAVNKIKPSEKRKFVIELLEKIGVEEEKANRKSIKRNMGLYNAG